MAVGTTLASAVVMGLFLIVVAVFTRQHGWRAYTPAAVGGGAGGAAGRIGSGPAWWTAGFLALVAVFGGGALALVTGTVDAETLQLGLAGAGGAVLGLFFLFGVYHAVRSRGGAAARAVAVSVWVVGLLVVGGILVKLLVA